MIEEIKKNGNINIQELSVKQLIALLNLWDANYAQQENNSFSSMVARCYKSSPWHVNSPILYIHSDNKTVTTVRHAFHNLYEYEEVKIIEVLKNALV